MKKRIFTFLLALLVLAGGVCVETENVFAYTDEQLNSADALYSLKLILGTGSSYDLDSTLTREQAVVILIRLLGKESEVGKKKDKNPFKDVSGWSEKYIAYGYRTGLLKGVSKTEFAPLDKIDITMFSTFCLRALGYDDGEDGDFEYRQAPNFAKSKGIKSDYVKGDYLRGNAIYTMMSTLSCLMKKDTKKLSDKMITEKLFTKNQYEHALEIAELGRTKDDPTAELSKIDKYRDAEAKPSGGGGGGGAPAGGGGGGGGGGTVTPPPHVHTYVDGVCTGCGEKDPNYVPPHVHNYINGICKGCGEKDPNYKQPDLPVVNPDPGTIVLPPIAL